MGPLSEKAILLLFFFFSSVCNGCQLLGERLAPLGEIFFIRHRLHLGRTVLSRETDRNLQKLSTFEKKNNKTS